MSVMEWRPELQKGGFLSQRTKRLRSLESLVCKKKEKKVDRLRSNSQSITSSYAGNCFSLSRFLPIGKYSKETTGSP